MATLRKVNEAALVNPLETSLTKEATIFPCCSVFSVEDAKALEEKADCDRRCHVMCRSIYVGQTCHIVLKRS